MSKWVAVRILLLIGALIAVAGGAAYWISRPPVPFDEAFQFCDEDEAEWRLIVTYGPDGEPDQRTFIACFRQPEPSKDNSGSWLRWWEPTAEEWEDVGGIASIANWLGTGTDGNWCYYSSLETITENATGVDLTIELSKSGDPVAKETISLPFPEAVTGRVRKISYSARWEEIPEAES